MLKHPLIQTLVSLRGNTKASVLTEPLWGIPYNLYIAYASPYMSELGLKDSQIGLIVSIGLVVQIFGAVLGGAITDKLGRRKTTAIFDFIAWSIPTMIWAIAQDFNYFLVAALFNGAWRITQTSWGCLLVEDADPEHLVDIYSWVQISGLLSGFFAPITWILMSAFDLVSTMRGLYWFAFAMMTAKLFILYIYSTETRQGAIRMEETRNQSLLSLVTGYGDVFKQVLNTPRTLFTLGILLTVTLASTINGTFWSLLVINKIMIAEQHVALYTFARSIVMMFFFFLAMPRIKEMHFRNPMVVGFSLLALSQIILVFAPEKSYALLLLSILIEACSYATVITQVDRMIVVTVDAQERARIMALLWLIIIIVSTPFGWIAGQLSEINRILPFVLNICLLIIGGILVLLAARHTAQESSAEATSAAVGPVTEPD